VSGGPSRLGALLTEAKRGLAPWEAVPPASLPAVAAACGPAERAEVETRLAALRAELETVPEWDGDTRDDVWRAIELFEALRALCGEPAAEAG
jgi:hypothetical protein